MSVSIIPEALSITMPTKRWIMLMGILASTRDNSGIVELLENKIMDQIE